MRKINIDQTNGPDPIRAERPSDTRKAGTKAVSESPVKVAKSEDRLSFSTRASEVGRLVDELKAMPEVRKAQMSILIEPIRTGKYMPSADSIADAILKDEQK
jgi:flagellar biosynthesis anti-sigma factor FlgM